MIMRLRMFNNGEKAKLAAARMGFVMVCAFVAGAISWQLVLFLYGIVAGLLS